MQSLHVFLLKQDSIVLTRWFRLYATNLGKTVQFGTLPGSEKRFLGGLLANRN
jgi:hypothetical protein